MTSFHNRQLTSQPLHLLRGPQGLGERCCIVRFSMTTWQVPGSMGFVRSKHETKHHLWNGILIDCCSHYQVRVPKLFSVYGKKHYGEAEARVGGGHGGRRIWGSWSSAEQRASSCAQLHKSWRQFKISSIRCVNAVRLLRTCMQKKLFQLICTCIESYFRSFFVVFLTQYCFFPSVTFCVSVSVVSL